MIARALRAGGVALVLAPVIPLLAAVPRPAGVFAFPSLEVGHIARTVEETIIVGAAYDEDSHQDYPDETGFLTVLEGGKLMAWYVQGSFAVACAGDNGIAIVYAASGSKSAPISCDGTELGLDGALVRRVFSGTYQSTATITGDIVEFTGTMTGRSLFYYRASDQSPTFDTAGTVQQHARLQVSRGRCRILQWETRSDVREDYNPGAHGDGGTRSAKNEVTTERGSGATSCQFEAS